MSEPELAYMGGNDEFDLPRWQTQTIGRDQHDYLSSSAQAAHAAQHATTPYLNPYPPPQQQLHHRLNSQPTTTLTPTSPTSRAHHLIDAANDGAQSTSLPYLSPTNHANLSRSASLGAATLTSAARGRRQHHNMQDDIEGNPPQPASYANTNTNNGHTHSHSRQHSTSFYPPSVPYPSSSYPEPAPSASDPSSPYTDLYFSTQHAPKRSLTHHDSSSSSSAAAAAAASRAARSPLRTAGQSQSGSGQGAFLDPYAASSQQQSQYSPTTANYPPSVGAATATNSIPPYQSPPYIGGHPRATSKTGGDILTPPIQSPYTPSQLTAAPPQSQSSQAAAQQSRYSPSSYGLGVGGMDTSSPHPPHQSQSQSHITIPPRQNSISQPSTPLQFPVPTHSPAYGPQDAMVVDPPQKRRASGFRRVRDQRDLRPHVNPRPGGRRVDAAGQFLSVRCVPFLFSSTSFPFPCCASRVVLVGRWCSVLFRALADMTYDMTYTKTAPPPIDDEHHRHLPHREPAVQVRIGDEPSEGAHQAEQAVA